MARLVADIGGTNCRFAFVADDGGLHDLRHLPVRDYPGPVEAARAYLGDRAVVDAVFAVATVIEGDEIAFTNSPWRFSIRRTREALGLARLAVINDFVAQALAVPRLAPGDCIRYGGADPAPDRPIAVIGPGTGLGVGALVPTAQGWLPVASEGGHVSLAPADDLEIEVLRILRRRFGHVSFERVLSGPGLLNLAEALAQIRGHELEPTTPEGVSQRAAAGSCPICVEAVHRFVCILGGAAGDLAVTFLARGGIYIAGGICKRLGPLFDGKAFRARFEAKGRLGAFLAQVPAYLITRSNIGLLGAAAYDIEAERG